jgi:DNA processing protein
MPPDGSPTDKRLDHRERIARLRLTRSDGVGPVTFRELLDHFGSAEAALAAVPELAARGGRRLRICAPELAEQEMDALDSIGAKLIALGEADYPSWLAHIDSAPPLIALRGDAAVLQRPAVAIVGSRNASVGGVKFAKQLARDLGARGYVVASGLARGIDAAAHEASTATGTIAVLAGGLDRIYPPENTALADRIIAEGGVHLTEMPLGWEPRARDFPRRNRLVSGLSLGVVVIEAADRSGSLITARLAGEQGRIVFAVPGSPLDPRAAGTNRLLRDGARIVTGVDDIIGEIEPMIAREPARDMPSAPDGAAPPADAGDVDREKILDALGSAPVEVDEIVRFTGLKPALVHLVLLELDLAGRIGRHPGGRVSLIAR